MLAGRGAAPMARRKKEDEAERRSAFLGLHLTPSEKAELLGRAADVGLSVSDFARMVLFLDGGRTRAERPQPPRPYGSFRAIKMLGTNINQLAHVANATNEIPSERVLREIAAQIDEVLQKVLA